MPMGLFAVVVGAGEAAYYSLERGPSGDDYTGLAVIPAGVLLVVLGAVVLWRSRRRDDGRVRRYLRRLALFVGGFVAAYIVLFPFALSYVFTHAARAAVPAADLGAAHQNVAFRTADGLTLRGWYVPSRNRAAVMLPSDSQVPTTGFPSFNSRLTGLERIERPLLFSHL